MFASSLQEWGSNILYYEININNFVNIFFYRCDYEVYTCDTALKNFSRMLVTYDANMFVICSLYGTIDIIIIIKIVINN